MCVFVCVCVCGGGGGGGGGGGEKEIAIFSGGIIIMQKYRYRLLEITEHRHSYNHSPLATHFVWTFCNLCMVTVHAASLPLPPDLLLSLALGVLEFLQGLGHGPPSYPSTPHSHPVAKLLQVLQLGGGGEGCGNSSEGKAGEEATAEKKTLKEAQQTYHFHDCVNANQRV